MRMSAYSQVLQCPDCKEPISQAALSALLHVKILGVINHGKWLCEGCKSDLQISGKAPGLLEFWQVGSGISWLIIIGWSMLLVYGSVDKSFGALAALAAALVWFYFMLSVFAITFRKTIPFLLKVTKQ